MDNRTATATDDLERAITHARLLIPVMRATENCLEARLDASGISDTEPRPITMHGGDVEALRTLIQFATDTEAKGPLPMAVTQSRTRLAALIGDNGNG